jgi:hypothetical protein
MNRTSPIDETLATMDAEEKYQQIFSEFARALRSLAMDADPQCESAGDFNVAQELKYEILSGRYVIGKGKLNETEETAITALASAIDAVPGSALTFAEGHAANVRNMMHPAWTPIRARAVLLLALLDSHIAQNKAYFDQH